MKKTVVICALVVAVAPIVMFVGYTGPALKRLEMQNQQVMAQLDAAVVAATKLASVVPREDRLPPRVSRSEVPPTVQDIVIPTKWAAKYLTPRYYQEDRGTCWDFATVGILEQSYRANGVAKGYLSADQYVRFNEQAYGISMIEACKGHPDVCDVVGDFVYQNSTTGGEVWWLYSLTSLYDKLLPASVCPYTDIEHEHECPDIQQALRNNPIRFTISSMETAYTPLETKRLMIAHQAPLAWSSEMHVVVYYFPCTEEFWAKQPECVASVAVDCPRKYGSGKCARIETTMYDLDAEFLTHEETIGEGGHAMNVVGFNDEFVTKFGQKGGFIIRNSWHDKLYSTKARGGRGSHSVAYFMNEISAWDEKLICPGPENPENWLSCVQQSAGPTMKVEGRHRLEVKEGNDATYDIKDTCLSKPFMDHLLNVSLQPNEFVCTDASFCSTDSRYRYFLIDSIRNPRQDLAKVCMLQYDTITAAQATLCTPYLIPTKIAYLFTPIPSQLAKLQNSEDLCGYWFWPYEMLDKQVGLYNNYYSNYFDIKWDDSSYAAKASSYPQYDYSWLKKSTGTQKSITFTTPSPFANKRY